ncbi:MAG TPA: hypothetical protein VIK54_17845, partial [Acidimicrobiia bacterium]
KSTTPATKAKKRGPGRRAKLTPETLEHIRAGVAAGLPMEFAARLAGVGKSAFHNWRNDGELALDKQSKGQVLSDRERARLDVVIMLRDAHAERLAILHEKLDAEATNHRKTTTKIVLNPVIYKGHVLRDDNGEILKVPTVSMVTTEEPDTNALAMLYSKAYEHMEKLADIESRTESPNSTHGLTESVEARLARSIRVRREQLHEDHEDEIDRQVNERLEAMGITAPSSPAARSRDTDDDDEYYEYSPWVSPYVPEFDSGNSGNSGNSDSDPGT